MISIETLPKTESTVSIALMLSVAFCLLLRLSKTLSDKLLTPRLILFTPASLRADR